MDAFQQLDIIAEVSVSLLGFVAIFLALSRDDGRFSEADRHFVQAIVLSAAIAAIGSLLPRSAAQLLDEESAWLVSALVAAMIGTAAIFVSIWYQSRMTRQEALKIHWFWHLAAWSLATTGAAFMVLAVVNPIQRPGFYVVSMTILAAQAVWSFIAIVYRRFF